MTRSDTISRGAAVRLAWLALATALGLTACSSEPLPALLASWPAHGERAFARSEWLQLEFASAPPERLAREIALRCGGEPQPLAVHAAAPNWLILNPRGALPAGASCALGWDGPSGPASIDFATADAGEPVRARQDPRRRDRVSPYPDDFWTREDPGSPTGLRLALRVPERESDVRWLFRSLLAQVDDLDGFSPLGPFVAEFTASLDPASLPGTPGESLEPTASAALLDLDPESERFGQRVPFRVDLRHDVSPAGLESHVMLVYPSVPLEPGSRYGFVLTRRARADAGRPLAPSDAFAAALAPAASGEAPEIARLRTLTAPVLAAAEALAPVPIPRDDVALAVRFSVRSLDSIARDLLAVRAVVQEDPPPAFEIERVAVEPPESPVAAVVHGIWWAPDWRSGVVLARDREGLPRITRVRPVPYTLALPRTALAGPVPLVVYQHGNPGSAEVEVPGEARRYLAEAGFAVVGFTDVLNRELGRPGADTANTIAAQIFHLMFQLLVYDRLPDIWWETLAEQIAFVRFAGSLAGLDLLPVGAPDGRPDLDAAAPLTYLGVSEGANHGSALLAYAPEISAAVLVAGGARRVESLVHQRRGTFLDVLPAFFPEFAPVDLWVALAMAQTAIDHQDPHNHARFLTRDPVLPRGAAGAPDILLVAGLGDRLVPNHATDSLAWQLGLPLLDASPRALPWLARTGLPVAGNLASGASGGYYRYVPYGLPDLEPTPGCVPPVVPLATGAEGHFCVQAARESLDQRVAFLRSVALEASPRIDAPRVVAKPAVSLVPSEGERKPPAGG